MSARAELAAMQAAWSALLRTPLDRRGGTLRAPVEGYAPALRGRIVGDAGARLGVYHRQYWFRLFTAFQHEYPLTAAVLGAWTFNGVVADFLAAAPPRARQLVVVCDGLADFLAVAGAVATVPASPPVPAAVVRAAAAIDEGFRRAGAHAASPPDAAAAAIRAAGTRARLRPAPSLTLVEEAWPLLALRHGLPDAPAATPCARPAAYADGPRAWAIAATATGVAATPVAPAQLALLRHLAAAPLEDALGAFAAAFPAITPAQVQDHLADSVRRGLWAAEASP